MNVNDRLFEFGKRCLYTMEKLANGELQDQDPAVYLLQLWTDTRPDPGQDHAPAFVSQSDMEKLHTAGTKFLRLCKGMEPIDFDPRVLPASLRGE